MMIRFKLEKVRKGLIFQILEVSPFVDQMRDVKMEWTISNSYQICINKYPELDCTNKRIYITGKTRSEDHDLCVEKYQTDFIRNHHFNMIISALREWVILITPSEPVEVLEVLEVTSNLYEF